ncbi:hypothetical protein, partial [Serratia marcescens]|uniref:hypothetical protein n=1 Tax=Serratia marcescens TaxID=615 RepID=UPI001C37810F
AHKLFLRDCHLGLLLALALPLETHCEPLLARGVMLSLRGVHLHAVVHGAVLGAASKRYGKSSAEGTRSKGWAKLLASPFGVSSNLAISRVRNHHGKRTFNLFRTLLSYARVVDIPHL